MRAALYARVSTEAQADRGTIGSQLQLLRQQGSVSAVWSSVLGVALLVSAPVRWFWVSSFSWSPGHGLCKTCSPTGRQSIAGVPTCWSR